MYIQTEVDSEIATLKEKLGELTVALETKTGNFCCYVDNSCNPYNVIYYMNEFISWIVFYMQLLLMTIAQS